MCVSGVVLICCFSIVVVGLFGWVVGCCCFVGYVVLLCVVVILVVLFGVLDFVLLLTCFLFHRLLFVFRLWFNACLVWLFVF